MPKNHQFKRVFENLKLAVKQCYQTGQLLDDNCWKMPKLKNSNATLGVTFKHCDNVWLLWYFDDQNNFSLNIWITMKYINLFHEIWKKIGKYFFASFGVINKWNPHAHFFRIAPFTLKSTSLKSHGNIRIFPVRNWTPPHEW